MKKKRKNAFTLIEVMVFLFIVVIVGSVIGVNVRGSMEKGKLFKTEHGSRRVYEILNTEAGMRPDELETIVKNTEATLRISGLAGDPKKLIVDGWGTRYVITEKEGQIFVTSPKFLKHQAKAHKMNKSQLEEKYYWMDTGVLQKH